jgi:hypothetical protein
VSGPGSYRRHHQAVKIHDWRHFSRTSRPATLATWDEIREQMAPTFTNEANFPGAPGALLLRLLHNGNIRPHNARILKEIGDGPYASELPREFHGPVIAVHASVPLSSSTG